MLKMEDLSVNLTLSRWDAKLRLYNKVRCSSVINDDDVNTTFNYGNKMET